MMQPLNDTSESGPQQSKRSIAQFQSMCILFLYDPTRFSFSSCLLSFWFVWIELIGSRAALVCERAVSGAFVLESGQQASLLLQQAKPVCPPRTYSKRLKKWPFAKTTCCFAEFSSSFRSPIAGTRSALCWWVQWECEPWSFTCSLAPCKTELKTIWFAPLMRCVVTPRPSWTRCCLPSELGQRGCGVARFFCWSGAWRSRLSVHWRKGSRTTWWQMGLSCSIAFEAALTPVEAI